MTNTATIDEAVIEDLFAAAWWNEPSVVAVGDEHDIRPETLCVGEAR
jgi:hypothetical protein